MIHNIHQLNYQGEIPLGYQLHGNDQHDIKYDGVFLYHFQMLRMKPREVSVAVDP